MIDHFKEFHDFTWRVQMVCAFGAYLSLAIGMSAHFTHQLQWNIRAFQLSRMEDQLPPWKAQLFRFFAVASWIPGLQLLGLGYLILSWIVPAIKWMVMIVPWFFKFLYHYNVHNPTKRSKR